MSGGGSGRVGGGGGGGDGGGGRRYGADNQQMRPGVKLNQVSLNEACYCNVKTTSNSRAIQTFKSNSNGHAFACCSRGAVPLLRSRRVRGVIQWVFDAGIQIAIFNVAASGTCVDAHSADAAARRNRAGAGALLWLC